MKTHPWWRVRKISVSSLRRWLRTKARKQSKKETRASAITNMLSTMMRVAYTEVLDTHS